MRSSSPTTLNFPDDVVVDINETEALLDDYDADIDGTSDVDVLVETESESESEADVEDVAEPHAQKLRHRNYLSQDISTCLAMLRLIQDEAIPAKQKPYSRKIKIYATVALLFSISAIVTPAYFVKRLVEVGLWQSDETIANLRPLQQELVHEDNAAWDNYTRARNSYSSYLYEMQRILLSYIDDWFVASSPGAFCSNDEIMIPPHTIHDNDVDVIEDDLFCKMNEFYKNNNDDQFTDFCRNIANDACSTAAHFPDLQADIQRTRVDMDDLKMKWDDVAAKLHGVNNEIEAANLVATKATGVLVAGSLAVAVALLITALTYALCRGSYREDIAKTLLLNEYLNNPAEANALINLIVRLNLKIDDTTTVAGLIAQLEAKQKEIDERWKQRTAFINGLKCSESSSHLFFRQADHNLVKMIFDEAGLGPVQKPAL